MKIYKQNINTAKPFVTKDSSVIRTVLDLTNADVKKVSLAEASLKSGKSTIEHLHNKTEEIYYFTSGSGVMWVGGKKTNVKNVMGF
jgi:mannose-6-phosphate isomerase-like protein (cupin superfamily)